MRNTKPRPMVKNLFPNEADKTKLYKTYEAAVQMRERSSEQEFIDLANELIRVAEARFVCDSWYVWEYFRRGA